MKNKRLIVLLFLIIILSLTVACSKNKTEVQNLDLFNPKIASNLAEEYLELVKNNNIEEANKLCTEKLLAKNKEISLGDSKIIAFAPDSVIESSRAAYVTFNVVRNSESEPKCDLDNYAIRVIKDNASYKIDEVKAMNKKQIFVRNNSLRMIGESGGDSNLIITLKNMPKDIYLKENNLMLYKDNIVSDSFGIVSLGYEGQRIAISTMGNDKTLLTIAYIEESKPAQASNVSGETTEIEGSLEDVLDKPIAKKVITLDMLEKISLRNLVFTREEGYLIVEYTNDKSNSRINIYDTSNGDLIPLKFDSIFPVEKYSLTLKSFDKDECIIDVKGKSGESNVREELFGEYKINIKDATVKKSI